MQPFELLLKSILQPLSSYVIHFSNILDKEMVLQSCVLIDLSAVKSKLSF